MVRAKQFIDVQTPNGYTRVGRLIKSITSRDPSIVAAITHIHGNQDMNQDFEQAADFLLLTAPSNNINEPSHRISATNTGTSPGTGDVELRYYSKKIASTTSTTDDDTPTEVSALKFDSHADSPVVGKYCLVFRRTGRQVKVSGFTDQLGAPIQVEVVDAAVAHDCEYTGKTYMLVLRNALYLPRMTVSLVLPSMMRLAGIDLNECPKFLSKSPTIEYHSIYFSDFHLRIPLHLHGVISYLPV